MGRHTVEYRADENPSEIGLLSEVQRIWDLWGVGTIGPGLCRRVGHGLGLRNWASWDSWAEVEGGRGDSVRREGRRRRVSVGYEPHGRLHRKMTPVIDDQ